VCVCVCVCVSTLFGLKRRFSRPHSARQSAKAIRQAHAHRQTRSCTAVSCLIIHPTTERGRERERELWSEGERERRAITDGRERLRVLLGSKNTGWASSDMRERLREGEREREGGRERERGVKVSEREGHQIYLRKVNKTD